MNKPKVIVICGPTVSGKTKLSIELAKKIESDKELQQLVLDSNKRIMTLKEKAGLI